MSASRIVHWLNQDAKGSKIIFIICISYLAVFLSACSSTAPSIVNPKGPAAGEINWLTWFLFITGGLVYILVMVFLFVGLFRRRGKDLAVINQRRERVWIFGGGVIATASILLVVYGLTVLVLSRVSGPGDPSDLSVRVTAQQWWWHIEYPGLGVVTANEIHIPTGQQVLLDLRSPDVIHSFWVPQLHGKRDVIPGQTNTFWIEANEPGVYWGECAEFCGTQHAKMRFVVVAETPEEFESWLESQRQEAALSDNPYYQQGLKVFMQSGCAGCHTIQGSQATGDLGPDLTHLASRLTLAAGALENNQGNLGGWVADPQGIKPGNKMPSIEIPSEDFRALVDFLMTLE